MANLTFLYGEVAAASDAEQKASHGKMQAACTAVLAVMILRNCSAGWATGVVETEAKLAKSSISKVGSVATKLLEEFRTTLTQQHDETIVCDAAIAFVAGKNVSQIYKDGREATNAKTKATLAASASEEAAKATEKATKAKGMDLTVAALDAEAAITTQVSILLAAGLANHTGAQASLARVMKLVEDAAAQVVAHNAKVYAEEPVAQAA